MENFMKAFMILGDLTNEKESREDKLKYKERIVFATPGIVKPEDWDSLPIEEREKRIEKIQNM